MMRSKLATYAMGFAVAAALTGCGDDDDSGDSKDFADEKPADIVDAARAAMTELEALKVSGEMRSEGQAASIDFQLATDGNCTGTLDIGTGVIEVLGVGGDRWFKADEAFWSTTGIPDTTAVVDKWVIDSEGEFAEFCDVEDFVDGLIDDESEETYEVKGTEDVDGEEVVVIEQTDDEEGVSSGYIRTDEPHYMVKIEKEGDEGGAVTFSEFDEEFDVTAPSDDEVVDLNQLG